MLRCVFRKVLQCESQFTSVWDHSFSFSQARLWFYLIWCLAHRCCLSLILDLRSWMTLWHVPSYLKLVCALGAGTQFPWGVGSCCMRDTQHSFHRCEFLPVPWRGSRGGWTSAQWENAMAWRQAHEGVRVDGLRDPFQACVIFPLRPWNLLCRAAERASALDPAPELESPICLFLAGKPGTKSPNLPLSVFLPANGRYWYLW